MEIGKIVTKVNEQLNKGVVIVTGVGVFAAIFAENKERMLLRRRLERESLIYGKDLSGKWELPGGTIELSDLNEDYQGLFENCLKREVKEETGLEIQEFPKIILLPAVLKKSAIEKLNLIDFAFVTPMDFGYFKETDDFREKLMEGKIQWIQTEKIAEIQIVSERMKYLINIVIEYIKSLSQK